MEEQGESRVTRVVVAALASPLVTKVGQAIYLTGMLLSCLIRTFLNPATQLRLMERLSEPFTRAADWAVALVLSRLLWLWQPVVQVLTLGIKRLSSLL